MPIVKMPIDEGDKKNPNLVKSRLAKLNPSMLPWLLQSPTAVQYCQSIHTRRKER